MIVGASSNDEQLPTVFETVKGRKPSIGMIKPPDINSNQSERPRTTGVNTRKKRPNDLVL